MNLQKEKEDQAKQIQTLKDTKQDAQTIQSQNQNIEKIMSGIQSGGQGTEQVLSQLKIILDSNQALSSKIQQLGSNKQSDKEFENLREQNAQLQILVKNLGDQLYQQTQQFMKEQDFKNTLAQIQAERDTLSK